MLDSSLRSDLADLTGLASRDLSALWDQVADATSAREALNDLLPGVISTFGAAAATLAANWYDELRDKVGARGRFTAIPADVVNSGSAALVGWALSEAGDFSSFQTLVEGGMQRRILTFSRETITGSTIADPAARGWQRTGAGECPFCAMLIGRGAVYTEASADFASHDHCRCSAVPAFDGEPVPVKPFTPTNRNITDADRARVREWIASH